MAKNKKVILRADGGPNIGMGHFVRTLALGEMLQDDFYCIYATRVPTNQQKQEIKNVCHELIELPADDSHFNDFLKYLQGDEIVVLDNYYFHTEYQKKIKNIGSKLVCIDDMHDKHYVTDVVINHAEGINDEAFSIEKYTKLYKGFKYALLRKPFLRETESQKRCFDILISMGGSDPYDISNELVSKINNTYSDLQIGIILGSAYNGGLKQKTLSKNIRLFTNQSAQNIIKLMKRSYFGIFPASTIAIEAIAARLPFAIGYFTNNQKEIYLGIINNKLGFPLGFLKELDISMVNQLLIKIRNSEKKDFQDIKEKQYEKLDKQSPQRINKIFNNL